MLLKTFLLEKEIQIFCAKKVPQLIDEIFLTLEAILNKQVEKKNKKMKKKRLILKTKSLTICITINHSK